MKLQKKIKKTHTTIRDNESKRACEEIHFSISPSEKRIIFFFAYGFQLEIAWVSDSGFFLLPISVLGPHQTPGLSDLCMTPVCDFICALVLPVLEGITRAGG